MTTQTGPGCNRPHTGHSHAASLTTVDDVLIAGCLVDDRVVGRGHDDIGGTVVGRRGCHGRGAELDAANEQIVCDRPGFGTEFRFGRLPQSLGGATDEFGDHRALAGSGEAVRREQDHPVGRGYLGDEVNRTGRDGSMEALAELLLVHGAQGVEVLLLDGIAAVRGPLAGDVGQRLSVPQLYGFLVRGNDLSRYAGASMCASLGHQRGEPVIVDELAVDAQAVRARSVIAKAVASSARKLEGPPNRPRIGRDGLLGIRRLIVAPHVIDQRVDREPVTGVERERGQDAAFASTRQRDDGSVVVDLHIAQQTDIQRVLRGVLVQCGMSVRAVSGLVFGFVSRIAGKPSAMNEEWLEVPVGRGASHWVTVATRRTVLAVVHTVAGMGHLLDAVELVECDPRIQVVFTQAPDVFSNGVSGYLESLGCAVVPWRQAIRNPFDLALTTDSAGFHQLQAPVLYLSHGVMNNKLAPSALGGPASGHVVGLGAPWLTWYGRLVPAMVALSHVELLEVLADQCPPALEVAKVVGDLCLDRLVASRAHRRGYRAALGVDDDRPLVAVSSTWGRQSMFARSLPLLDNMVTGLVHAGYAVMTALHPALWFGHGPRQVLAWLREQRRCGLGLVEPLDWRALVTAADIVLGDHGSATVYAAAAGVPALRLPTVAGSVRVGSAVAELARTAGTLRPARPLPVQLDRALAGFCPQAVAARVTSEPGRAAQLLRSRMYELLRLAEPATPAETNPVPLAQLIDRQGVRP